MNLIRVERELKERLSSPYKWGRKQSNEWDSKTNFIYKTYSFKKLQERTEELDATLKNYALNRWFNFWSAMAVEDLFCSSAIVYPNKNKFDKLVDFSLSNIPFDHKTTIFPKGFNQSIEYAKSHKEELIKWLYENQSQEGRKHHKSRLFIVLYDAKYGNHWKMKAEVQLLKEHINSYLNKFDKDQLIELRYNNENVFSDIIWITNPK